MKKAWIIMLIVAALFIGALMLKTYQRRIARGREKHLARLEQRCEDLRFSIEMDQRVMDVGIRPTGRSIEDKQREIDELEDEISRIKNL